MDNDGIEESVVAKSTGEQEEKDMAPQDATLYRVLTLKKKITKAEAGYQERENKDDKACVECKFNLSVEKQCHIVEGEINNDYGVSNFFSPKGDGMLPGDIVWDFIKKTGRKLEYGDGHVINNGAEGYQCKDCKYYLYSCRCLLIKGSSFEPEMSCALVVKIGNGIDV